MAIITPWIIAIMLFEDAEDARTEMAQALDKQPIVVNYKPRDTIQKVDHSQFEILQQEFETPQAVTKACLSCHNLTDHEIMSGTHWKWARINIKENGDTIQLGKRNIINNFCVGTATNYPRCTSCHIGFGWKDEKFDFNNGENIDCMVCHDQTKTYKKFPTKAGYPVTDTAVFDGKTFTPPDFNHVAQNVGPTSRETCGSCHYYGGGGNNIKHGDMSNALNNTTKAVDVHMGKDGQDMSCTECHVTEHHQMTGQLYAVSSENKERVTCEQCHSEKPHADKHLNLHSNKVSCQACHIPEFAKVHPTKMYWDWGQAGKKKEDGGMLVIKDSLGRMTYHTKKGYFEWGQHVKPEYLWFNGEAEHYMLGDKVDTTEPVQLNTLLGSYSDPNAKIVPVKVHRGRQIYDTEHNILINPHLFGNDSTSYWKHFDWDKASRTGQEALGLPYSGHYGFLNTEMYWPVNHSVSEVGEALSCTECHAQNGRLSGLNDFYLLGRDKNTWVDWLGIILIIGATAGVFVHALLRVLKSKKHI